MTDAKDSSKYCFDVALNAMNYASDKTRWTPNNIKRLIISPDGVIVQCHTSNKFINKVFDREKAYCCFASSNYKPMITTLVDRVCSSVEEVIFCTSGINGLRLPEIELELTSILDSRKSNQTTTQLIENIGKRFVRLRAILIMNCTISDFKNVFGQNLLSHSYHCADDLQALKSANVTSVIDIHKTDWYKGYYFRPKDYIADAEGGVLYNTLKSVEAKIEKEKESSRIEESKSKHLGDLCSKVYTAETRAYRLLVLYKLLGKYVHNCQTSCLLISYDTSSIMRKLMLTVTRNSLVDDEKLLSDRFIKVYQLLHGKVLCSQNSGKDSRVSAEDLIGQLTVLSDNLYTNLCSQFLDSIDTFGKMYPLTTKIKLSAFDRVVYIPESLSEQARGISEKYLTAPLEGTSVKDSVCNICSVISYLVVSDGNDIDDSSKKYFEKAAWVEKYDACILPEIGGTK